MAHGYCAVRPDGRGNPRAFIADVRHPEQGFAVGYIPVIAVLLVGQATPVRLLTSRPVRPTRLAVAADASLLAVADINNAVAVFDLRSSGSQPLQQFSAPGIVSTLTFHPRDRGLVVACGEQTVRIFDPTRTTETVRIQHPQPVRLLSVSDDGSVIATAADDGNVRVWAG